jgi:hypothetical protein
MALGDIGTYEGYGYRIGVSSGIMAAGLAAGAEIFQWRNSTANRKQRILRVTVNASVDATGFTVASGLFQMLVGRAYTVAGSGGSVTFTGNDQKLRTAQNPSILATAGIQIANTAALTAGTHTLDDNSIGNLVAACGAAGTAMVVGDPALYDSASAVGLYAPPLVLAQNEGFVIKATVPATGTWRFGVNVFWAEIDGGASGIG